MNNIVTKISSINVIEILYIKYQNYNYKFNLLLIFILPN